MRARELRRAPVFVLARWRADAFFFPVKIVSQLMVCACLCALGAWPLGAAEILVFAAASLADALKEVAPLYTSATGDTVRFNLGGSGALARQIKEGAPADVFFSADEERVDQLQQAGLLLDETRRNVLSNTLVLVVGNEGGPEIRSFADLARPGVRRVAFGEPATVPVGAYGKQYLEALGLWPDVSRKGVPLDNVRAVLGAVEAGNADAGIVYRTDALVSKKAKIAVEVPAREGPTIRYPVVVVKASKQTASARAFVEFLQRPETMAVFLRHGFLAAP